MLIIHKASAGSGKTYTLTYTYIKLLLGEKSAKDGLYYIAPSTDRNRHRGILAVTFTNKATEEMKQRIVARLSELADGRICAFRNDLCHDLHCNESTLQERSKQALSELLSDFAQFNVSTIDSFFQTVLRTFAREVNLMGSYDIELDENNATYVGVSQMLASINRTTANSPDHRRTEMLTAWLETYMNHRIASGKAFNIFIRHSNINSDLVKFIKDSLNETYKLNSGLIADYMADFDRIMRFGKALSETAKTLARKITESGKAILSIINENGWQNMLYASIISDATRWSNKEFSFTATTQQAIDNEAKRFKKDFRHNAGSQCDSHITGLLKECVDQINRYNFYSYVLEKLFYLGLIGEAERFAQIYLRENNAILLSSTNTILRAIINDEETPFIYERMGVRLRNFLIDEFQDTSRMQWLNLSPLIHESLATDSDNLIIGDEKQAIYRFRNSDPELISTDVPRDFSTQSQIRGNKPSENTNWRSSGTIVRFNNTLFSVLSSVLGQENIYKNVIQHIHHTDLPGYVKLFPYTSDMEQALQHMVEEIVRQIKSGYRQRDIAILVNRRSEGISVVNYLLGCTDKYPELKNLKIVTEEALKVSSSPVIERITSVMRFVDSHQSVTHGKSSNRGSGTNGLIAAICNRYQYNLSTGIDKETAIRNAFEVCDTYVEEMSLEAATMECFNLTSAVERIITRFVSDDERLQHNIYLSAFLDMVSDYCAHNPASLHNFMKWWDETGRTQSITVPSEIDAVAVMTIHKSKGLEYPCVHIPFADWPMKKLKRINWFETNTAATNGCISEFCLPELSPDDVPPFIPMEPSSKFLGTSLENQLNNITREEIIDNLNKTYVAFTRASRELIVAYKFNPPKKSTSASPHIGLLLNACINRADKAYSDTTAAATGVDADMLADLSSHIDNDGCFTLGQPTTYKADGQTDNFQISTRAVAMEAFSCNDNENIWQMNRIDNLETIQLPRRQGIIYHTIMNSIRRCSDIDKAVKRAVAEGILPATESSHVITELKKAVNNEKAIGWFDGFTRMMNERTISIADNKGVVSRYRPDRVVWCADGNIHVIDYKFGNEEPPNYIRQVRQYRSLISRIYPDTPVQGWLWWPMQERFIEVPFAPGQK